jgi:cyclopropane-fatty-acyl-phospholipid synthase
MTVETTRSLAPLSWLAHSGLFARAMRARLERLRGELWIVDGTQRLVLGHDAPGVPNAEIHVTDARFWRAVVLRGSVGLAESYAHGWWTSPDAVAVIRLLTRNIDLIHRIERTLGAISRPALAAYHKLRANTERGSRANIAAHYDLSNEFFSLLLDETMSYSCGVFESPDSTLEHASIAKLDRLCQKLELRADDHLVEIGGGWGALAIHAARSYGCRVTTTTISARQHAWAAARIRAAGLEDRVTLLFADYRRLPELTERAVHTTRGFDKLVSVEMIEAVGHRYYPQFFATCQQLLAPGGRMVLQAITIADQHYESTKDEVDFIQRYIFPGSCIPSITALCSAATTASDLRLVELDDIGRHYVPTLAAWRHNLRARWDDARALLQDDTFLRLFEFYLIYCEGGFAERHISDVHMVFSRPI